MIARLLLLKLMQGLEWFLYSVLVHSERTASPTSPSLLFETANRDSQSTVVLLVVALVWYLLIMANDEKLKLT